MMGSLDLEKIFESSVSKFKKFSSQFEVLPQFVYISYTIVSSGNLNSPHVKMAQSQDVTKADQLPSKASALDPWK